MKTKLHYRILVFILLLFLPKISYSQCAPTEVNLGNDTTLCQGETLSFDLSNLPDNPTVTWEDGSTSLTRTISTAGVYAVETNYLGGELVVNVSDDGYCEEERACQVVFHEPSSAGNDANFTFCNTEQSVDLYTLIADPSVETTGTWYDQQFNQILGGVFNFGQLEGEVNCYF